MTRLRATLYVCAALAWDLCVLTPADLLILRWRARHPTPPQEP